MLVKLIKSYRLVVAVCDSELLGKRFEEGNFQLHVKENFYGGEEMSEEETIEFLRHMAQEDATFNIVGENSVRAALEAGVIHEKSVGSVQGVQFAIVLL